jgi:hypothetical protein
MSLKEKNMNLKERSDILRLGLPLPPPPPPKNNEDVEIT